MNSAAACVRFQAHTAKQRSGRGIADVAVMAEKAAPVTARAIVLQDAIMELEAAVDAKQKDVDKVQDQRVRAYLRSRELHVRATSALEELAALARERHQQPPQSAATSIAWSMKSCLRRTLAKRYTPPDALVRSASTDPDSPASSCSTASSFAFGGDPIPAPLSIAGLLDCIPKHTASDVLPYACGPSPPVAGVLQHAAQSRRSLGALDIAEATVNRFTLLLQPLQEAVAAARGMPAARVRWHLQSPWNVATGTPVSFTPAMTSQECLSSGYFCAVAVALENLFLAISLNPAEPLPQLPGACFMLRKLRGRCRGARTCRATHACLCRMHALHFVRCWGP